jgi:cellulose synthase/poly-beta-1,6-N-acetylglucosamine synthase-like glycosyltransferase
MAEMLFISSIFLIFFAYFGYPLSLFFVSRGRDESAKNVTELPSVTFIVTVHNEEARIRGKLENTFSLDYPKDRLQLIIASDGSSDRTNEIVRSYSAQGVQLVDLRDRGGKESAQREAVKHATGEIIVFSDVATAMETGGLRQLVSSFSDPTVGCVSSEDCLLGRDGKPSGESLYVRYEMWLRRLESRANSLVGLSGSLFAARKEVCKDFSSEMQSDFRTVLNSVKLGLRGVSDPLAIGLYQDTADQKREWDRKIRTVVRGLTVFFRHMELLNVFQYGLFSYQLFCHKLLRWSVPFLLVLAFGSNLWLIHSAFIFRALLFSQALLYSIGIIGLVRPAMQNILPIKIPAYFLAVNASILIAWWRYLSGQRIITWTPTIR